MVKIIRVFAREEQQIRESSRAFIERRLLRGGAARERKSRGSDIKGEGGSKARTRAMQGRRKY